MERTDTPFTTAYRPGDRLRLPVAHGDGRFVADDGTLRALEEGGQVVLRYAPDGPGAEGNPNGSLNDIAGISNAAGNVVGIMPHPERIAETALGGEQGRGFFDSFMHALAARGAR